MVVYLNSKEKSHAVCEGILFYTRSWALDVVDVEIVRTVHLYVGEDLGCNHDEVRQRFDKYPLLLLIVVTAS